MTSHMFYKDFFLLPYFILKLRLIISLLSKFS